MLNKLELKSFSGMKVQFSEVSSTYRHTYTHTYIHTYTHTQIGKNAIPKVKKVPEENCSALRKVTAYKTRMHI